MNRCYLSSKLNYVLKLRYRIVENSRILYFDVKQIIKQEKRKLKKLYFYNSIFHFVILIDFVLYVYRIFFYI